MLLAPAASVVVLAAEEEFDPNDVTPGVEGFIITFVIMLVVLLLILDMVRRIRRVNYRAEVREQIEAEQAAADADADDAGAGGDGVPGVSAARGPEGAATTGEADAAASDGAKPE